MIRVGPPARGVDDQDAVDRVEPFREPGQSAARRRGVAPPRPSSPTWSISRSPARHTSTAARVAPLCLLTFGSSSETVKYAMPSIAGAGRAGQVHRPPFTGTVQRVATRGQRRRRARGR